MLSKIAFAALSLFSISFAQTRQEFYDQNSQYEELVAVTSYVGPEWVVDKMDWLPDGNKKMLDLGCANGMISAIVKQYRPDYRFDGVDFSQGMVDECVRRQIFAQAICADLSLGLPKQITDQYDVVFTTGCLEFIADHEKLFQEVHELLNPQGQFWLTVQAFAVETDDKGFMGDITTYTSEQIQALLTKVGFKIADFHYCPAAYVCTSSKMSVPYFLIIAKKEQD